MPSRAGWLLTVTGSVAAAALAWSAARPLRRAASAIDAQRWPNDGASLTRSTARFPAGMIRVAIDPGHGAPGNHGNTSSLCVEEQDAMLAVAAGLAERLEATGHFEVRLTRDAGRLVEYSTRLDEAASWGADAFVSLHSDVRGKVARWSPEPGHDCPIAVDAPGFAVLYSDEGEPAQAARRLALGRAVAFRMAEAGFLPYGGAAYAGIYAPDEDAPGVFVDRHAPEQRIFVLRHAAMPSILVETHNALDPREASRWSDPETLDAFAGAVAAAFGDVPVVTREAPPPSPRLRALTSPPPGGT
jgi:N-acetylmuramoyl-L-alanine amidase